MADEKQFALPGSSWETIKRIIRAFYAVQNEDNPTLMEIARLANVQRPVVSMNNNFLRSVGLVRVDDWKLTDNGLRYATALQMNNDSMLQESLADAARGNPVINQLLNVLKARGEIKIDTLKAELMLRLAIAAGDRQSQFIKPVFDMLQEAGLIEMEDDTVSLANVHGLGNEKPPQPPPPLKQPANDSPPSSEGLPLLLGQNKLAYLKLPSDWNKNDLPKLLKLLQIALGDDE